MRNTIPKDQQELERQKAIENVLLYGYTPTTLEEKKAAAIYGHASIDPIYRAKVEQSLSHILAILRASSDGLEDADLRKSLKSYLDVRPLALNIPVMVAKKRPVLAAYSPPATRSNYQTTYLPSVKGSSVNLLDFEQKVFNNKVQYRYLNDSNFATYVFNNILYSLGAQSVDELEQHDSWQAKLAILIPHMEFDELSVKDAFQNDRVVYNSKFYDTSFVPKYDVNSLVPQPNVNDTTTNDLDLINYHNNLNVKETSSVPMEKMAIFLVFPFKDGHLVQPNGKIVFLDYAIPVKRRSVELLLGNLCNTYNVEATIDDYARLIRLDEVKHHAIYAKSLNEQALALMIIKRLVGSHLRVGSHLVNIASEVTLLSWTEHYCSKVKDFILPPFYESDRAESANRLVKDIAGSCSSMMGACILCSGFKLPENLYSNVLKSIEESPDEDASTIDARKYVFYTLVLQEYQLTPFIQIRDQLKPSFGSNSIKLDHFDHFKASKKYVNKVYKDDPLVLPSTSTLCTKYDCFEMYEFVDNQLNKIVKGHPVDLSRHQFINFVTLMLQ